MICRCNPKKKKKKKARLYMRIKKRGEKKRRGRERGRTRRKKEEKKRKEGEEEGINSNVNVLSKLNHSNSFFVFLNWTVRETQIFVCYQKTGTKTSCFFIDIQLSFTDSLDKVKIVKESKVVNVITKLNIWSMLIQ